MLRAIRQKWHKMMSDDRPESPYRPTRPAFSSVTLGNLLAAISVFVTVGGGLWIIYQGHDKRIHDVEVSQAREDVLINDNVNRLTKLELSIPENHREVVEGQRRLYDKLDALVEQISILNGRISAMESTVRMLTPQTKRGDIQSNTSNDGGG